MWVATRTGPWFRGVVVVVWVAIWGAVRNDGTCRDRSSDGPAAPIDLTDLAISPPLETRALRPTFAPAPAAAAGGGGGPQDARFRAAGGVEADTVAAGPWRSNRVNRHRNIR